MHPGAIEFREATAADALTLSALAIQVFLDTYATRGVSPTLAREVFSLCSNEAFEKRFAEGGSRCVLAACGEHVLGLAEHRLAPTAPPNGGAPGIELVRLYVQPAAQRRGIGASLVQDAARAARRCGARNLWLMAWEENTRALAFYRRQGFADIGGADYVFEGQTFPNRVFVLALPAAGPTPTQRELR
jgi:ribosomal protein S18 acetylase RimI-like enzyme